MLTPEYERQLKELKELQALYAQHASPRNQLTQPCPDSRPDSRESSSSDGRESSASDPMIFPGLYSPSGFDILQILFQVQRRPNPTYTLGSIDSGVALVLCDSSHPHCPIVYCSEPFERLTGYSQSEVVGKNCRFLQYPYDAKTFGIFANPAVAAMQNLKNDPSFVARSTIRKAVACNSEAQVTLVNYRKNGERFLNLLTTIPVKWVTNEGEEKNYVIGFQAVAPPMFRPSY
ncbi:hypothetical protein DSL72_007391 [Monilinia vaccinii-corymbosi]|uniref:PAS domain-containing protein n=1 Tax=Monilinia vaccinii-corymbosi TaxID=61207 RepID=A0A8A3PMU5_9HELO|nr:hypothetical protein DSL72_007391 [Monilinia vaccinii-corymbosi]